MLRTLSCVTKQLGSLLPKQLIRCASNLEQYTIYDRAEGTYFEELDEEGFLINGNYYKGGVIAFNDIILLWDVQSLDKMTPESLKPVTLYNPPIDMLFIGTGKYTAPISKDVIEFLHQYNISVESMSTSSAAANFNFLHDDKERVAVALLPEQESQKSFESFFSVFYKHRHESLIPFSILQAHYSRTPSFP